MELKFIGANHEVTGSCHCLTVNGKYYLIDYGLEQGEDVYVNAKLPVPESNIEAVFITHAHVDHTGMLPSLFANGFRGNVYATPATVDLCSIMLRDCAHIQVTEAEWKNRKGRRKPGSPEFVPAYTMEDAMGIIKCLVPVEYEEKFEVDENLTIRFRDVGHLLGSSSIEIWAKEINKKGELTGKKIVFSGDIGNLDQPLIKDPIYTKSADYVVMESTYGDRLHEKDTGDKVAELAAILQETFDRGGNVVIPSFAVGRTQEILYYIRKIKLQKLLPQYPDFPVYVDSPLAVESTNIFRKNTASCFDEEALQLVKKGINPLTFPNLNLTITSDESKAINFDDTPKVIISASGMCEAGRIRHHLKHNLWREDSTILFVGYQSLGTLGRALVDGISEVKLFGETIGIAASIKQLKGMSGHADKDGLLTWINAFEKKPKKVFVVHGEHKAAESFAECLRSEYGFEAEVPYSGSTFDLEKNEFTVKAKPLFAEKKAKSGGNTVFERLLAAGHRLLTVIKKNEGTANKDLAKFADQINALSDKWDR